MILNFKTYNDLTTDIRKSIHKIPSEIDLIVGIPRSGMIPAYMIGAFKNLPVLSLDEYINDIKPHKGKRPISNYGKEKRILIVDDSICTGGALNEVKSVISSFNKNDTYIYYAVYAQNNNTDLIDIYATICEQNRIFQWNYTNHGILSRSCFDIDGVLCVDPTEEENDDGEKYIDFILNAKPLYIPKYSIYALVTSRLEKYREYTEEWLKKYNVQYENLYMLNLKSKEERIKLNAYGKFKSKVYSSLTNTLLFVESSRCQSIEISQNTNKVVICVETDEIFPSANNILDRKHKVSSINDIYTTWFSAFAISSNKDYLRITIFGIKFTLKVNETMLNNIAWWIPIKKWRNDFRDKFSY